MPTNRNRGKATMHKYPTPSLEKDYLTLDKKETERQTTVSKVRKEARTNSENSRKKTHSTLTEHESTLNK